MEENKKMLEEGIQKMIQDERIHDDYRNMFTAISNLISENKELEKENKELSIIKQCIETLQTNFANDDTYYVIAKRDFLQGSYKNLLDNYIPKSKIEYKIKELQEDIENINKKKKSKVYLDDYARNRLKAYKTKTAEIIKRLKELLEE